MKIVKLENGSIDFRTDSGYILKNVPPVALLEPGQQGKIVRVIQQQERIFNIPVNEVTSTQILPASEVAFSGTDQDLIKLLRNDFFFEVGGAIDRYPLNSLQAFKGDNHQSGTTAYAIVADTIYYIPIRLEADAVINDASILINVAAVGNATIGIYNFDLLTGEPTSKIFQYGEYDTNILNTQTLTLGVGNGVLLRAGVYCVAFHSSVNISVQGRISGFPILGFSSVLRMRSMLTQSLAYSPTLPASATTDGVIDDVSQPYTIHSVFKIDA